MDSSRSMLPHLLCGRKFYFVMFCWIYIFWILQIHVVVLTFNSSQCYFQQSQNHYSDGNVVIPAFISIFKNFNFYQMTHSIFDARHRLKFIIKNYQSYLGFIFAIEEINKNLHLLPNTSLGFDLYNVENGQYNIFRQVFLWLTGMRRNIPNFTCRRELKTGVILTGTSWKVSAHIGRLMNLYKYPQISFGTFDSILSDRGQFSSLYQIAPKDTSRSLGIISLLVYFTWTWVGLIFIDIHKETKFKSDIIEEFHNKEICLAFMHIISDNWIVTELSTKKTFELTMRSTANVIIIYDDSESVHSIVIVANYLFKTWKVWVMNKQVDSSIMEDPQDPLVFPLFHGSLYFSPHHDEISEFKKFIKTYTPSKYPKDLILAYVWITYFNCSLSLSDCKISSNCVPNASLELLPSNLWNVDMTEVTYNIYNAVYAIAHTLHKISHKQVQIQPHRNVEWNSKPWELHPFLKQIHFENDAGHHVVLDTQINLGEVYSIFNVWDFPNGLRQNIKVGTFSPSAPQGKELFLSDDMIQWPIAFTEIPRSVCSESCVPGFRKSPQEGKATCCYDCTPCPVNEISNKTDEHNCVKCPESHYANPQQNYCLQKAVTFLTYEDPLGMTLTFIALGCSLIAAGILGVFVKYHYTPIVKANNRVLTYILLITLIFCFLCPLLFIGHPSTATCILQQSTFAVLFTVVLSTVLAKTLTVVLAFKVTVRGRMLKWLMISRAPNFIIPICTLIQLLLCGIWLSISPPFIDSDAHSEHGHIIIVCNKGSELGYHCVLGYLCILALGSYTMAYLSMNLPDTFNEAKCLTFSMLMFFTVWATFLPVYHSTKGKIMVAMETFSILASSAGLLGCIFAPKCYIILLRPDRNSLNCIKNNVYTKRKSNSSIVHNYYLRRNF